MKISILIRTRFSAENLGFFLTLACISSYALLEHVSISIPAFSPIKYILLYIAGICIVFNITLIINNICKKKYFFVLILLLLVVCTLLFSAYMNRNPVVGSSPVYGTVRLILYLIELYALVIWVAETHRAEYVLRFLFRYLLLLVVVTDLLILTGWVQFSSGGYPTYLVGTKFVVVYRHIELLALWLMCDRDSLLKLRRKRWLILMTIIIVAISFLVDCMTGILGIIGFLWLYSFVNKRNQIGIQVISNPMVFALALLFSAGISFVIDAIATIPFVEYIIENLFQRNTTLTGRVYIFNSFAEKLSGRWLFGFGIGNGNAAAKRLFQYANAQNALLHWILQSGIWATISLCLWFCRIFAQLYNSQKYSQVIPIVVLVYVFVVVGIIETTFSMAFIFWCALILMCTSEMNMYGPSI